MIRRGVHPSRLRLGSSHALLMLGLIGLATNVPRPAAAFVAPTFVRAWGGFGPGDGQFNTPSGIAMDAAGAVYVTDSGRDNVQKFDSSGSFQLKWGAHGTAAGQLNDAFDVAADAGGNVFVMDTGNSRVDKFSNSGSFEQSIGTCCALLGPGGEFNSFPTSVATDAAGNLYVADSGNHRIQVFDGNGNFLRMWGSSGSGNGQFGDLRTLTVSSAGTVFAVDAQTQRVQAFDLSGAFLAAWGGGGAGSGQFSTPEGIATDSNGNVYVADTGNNRVQVFTATGMYLGQWGSSGSGNGQFAQPWDVAVQGSTVVVNDRGNGRIQEFTLAPVAAAPTSWGRVKSIYH